MVGQRIAVSLTVALLLAVTTLGGISRGEAFEIDWDKTVKFTGGLAAALAVHEGSHYLVAEIEGIEIDFHGLRWENRERYSTTLQLAGLMGDALSSEVILRVPAERRGPFEDGFLVWNIVEELTYPTLRYNESDFGNLRVPESEKAWYAALFVGHALYTAYRMDRDGRLSPEVWIGRVRSTPVAGCSWSW